MAKKCSQYTRRSFSIEKGLLCGITGEKTDSDYGENCTNYDADNAQIKIDEERYNRGVDYSLNQTSGANATIDVMPVKEDMPMNLSNVVWAILAGLLSGIACSTIWALLSVLTGYQFSIIAIGVGIVIGMTVRATGKSTSMVFGIIAVFISLLSFVFGDFLCNIGFLAKEENLPYFYTLRSFDWRYFFELAFAAMDLMSIVFYLIGASTAFSFVTRKEKQQAD